MEQTRNGPAPPSADTRTKAPHRPGPLDPALSAIAVLLAEADIEIGGERPWDMLIHHPQTADRILARGSLGLGESYMDGWWDCAQLDEFIARVLIARLDEKVGATALMVQGLRARLFNLQNMRRTWKVGQMHYDLGNNFFEAMLDGHLAYTCGYWAQADTLEDAQTAKLDLICRKLRLEPGMRLLDIGCGWGSLMKFAAERYGADCIGLTISREQAEHGQMRCSGLPVAFRLQDYRQFDRDDSERFDRIASIGMFEHVGHKNHRAFFKIARRHLKEDGLLLLHTIGKNRRRNPIDPWIERYIFPNGDLPSLGQIADSSENGFITEDVHNFGADYDRTLLAWHARFEAAWPHFATRYGERFRRMWRYYLLACAGTFRARSNQLWQVVLSPRGVVGGYRRPSESC
ncbi:cyclopropane fatty acyl phospholipid synthase [Thauera linaloolentis]|uniref:Cyclopropane fatty acyl phospholipid synthase n=2 Tax=Thauera linaloolentis TaxID=76112 RepID=N6YPD4_THAL4|nr:cyclopropane fatty acyl phospholipid synthase [Thauera linaloolentis]ENO84242.1 cyclopropane fatty acyl phospholipid synthase [Thauera linaloolentis 47Lol = DSM 12138]MCM8564108.1 cyclopropane fatty acyl phospholipid synthase [Thauera linaloolentis]